MKIKSIKGKLNNKFLVMLLMLIVTFMFSTSLISKSASADFPYDMTVAYQRFLLGTPIDVASDNNEKNTIPVLGHVGSGGLSGDFSYDGLVSTAPEGGKKEAQKFAATMATYSYYGYIKAIPQSVSSIGTGFVNSAMGAVLYFPALLYDVLHIIWQGFISIIMYVNIIPILANVMTGLGVSNDVSQIFGVSIEYLKTIYSVLIEIGFITIIILVVKTFSNGNSINRSAGKKLMGRMVNIAVMPFVVTACAYMMTFLGNNIGDNSNSQTVFSEYFVDSRTWAQNENWAPDPQNTYDTTDISPSKGTYVDTSFDPYSSIPSGDKGNVTLSKSKARIKAINAINGSLGNGLFSSTALVTAFMTQKTYTARDIIDYKGEEHENGTTGQYSNLSSDNVDKLFNFDSHYSLNGGPNQFVDVDESEDSGYQKAKDDYVSGKDNTHLVSSAQAYRDRFIFGAKDSGSKIEDYYKESPSLEQIYMKDISADRKGALSNQSLFLALSTNFNEHGGSYFISIPSNSVLSKVPSFDSNRSNYAEVNLVGNPIVSFFALFGKTCLNLSVTLIGILAIFTVGLLQMNLKPLMAWAKGLTKPDMEYSAAFIVYFAGIIFTMVIIGKSAEILTKILEAISSMAVGVISGLLNKIAGNNPNDASSPMQTQSGNSIAEIISAVPGLVFMYLLIKDPQFRLNAIALMTMPWEWAREVGERLERQASGQFGIGNTLDRNKQKLRNNQALKNMANVNENILGDDGKLKPEYKGLKGFGKQIGMLGAAYTSGTGVGKVYDAAKNVVPNINDILPDKNKGKDVIDRPKLDELGENELQDVKETMDKIHSNSDFNSMTVDAENKAKDAINEFENNPTNENKDKATQAIEDYQKALKNNGYIGESRALNGMASKLGNIEVSTPLNGESKKYVKNVDDGLNHFENADNLSESEQKEVQNAHVALREFKAIPTEGNRKKLVEAMSKAGNIVANSNMSDEDKIRFSKLQNDANKIYITDNAADFTEESGDIKINNNGEAKLQKSGKIKVNSIGNNLDILSSKVPTKHINSIVKQAEESLKNFELNPTSSNLDKLQKRLSIVDKDLDVQLTNKSLTSPEVNKLKDGLKIKSAMSVGQIMMSGNGKPKLTQNGANQADKMIKVLEQVKGKSGKVIANEAKIALNEYKENPSNENIMKVRKATEKVSNVIDTQIKGNNLNKSFGSQLQKELYFNPRLVKEVDDTKNNGLKRTKSRVHMPPTMPTNKFPKDIYQGNKMIDAINEDKIPQMISGLQQSLGSIGTESRIQNVLNGMQKSTTKQEFDVYLNDLSTQLKNISGGEKKNIDINSLNIIIGDLRSTKAK